MPKSKKKLNCFVNFVILQVHFQIIQLYLEQRRKYTRGIDGKITPHSKEHWKEMLHLFAQFKFQLIQIHFLYTVHGRKYSVSNKKLRTISNQLYTFYLPHLHSIYHHSSLLPNPLPPLFNFYGKNENLDWNAYFAMYRIIVVEWEQKEDLFIKEQMNLAIEKCNQIISKLM